LKLKRRRRDEGGIIMTPLIDMVFLTLLFFMVNAVLSINPAIRVDLPRARSSLGAVGRDVVVTVQADGGVFIDERRVSDDAFAVELRGALARAGVSSILLQADKSLPYERLVEVMDQAKIAGTGRISLATVRSGGR
jgi:biopolymer transport protein ExbD